MLLTGVGGVKAQKILTEGFEKKEAGSNYQSTVTVKSDESDCGIGWEIYYGTVSTSSKITGSNSAALRLYTSSNYGYIKSTTPVEGLSKVDFKAKAATSNGAKIKINVSYSTDGNSWISLETDKALTSSAAVYSYDIPSGGKFFQIAISSESTKPSKSSAQLTIDDVVFTYSDLGKENVDLSFGEISSQTVGVGKSVKIEATATPSVLISYSSSDETIAIVSTDGTVTGKKPGTTTIKASFAGNDQYNSASDEYELTVIPSELGGDVTEETIIINEPYGNSGNNAIILYDKGTNGQNGPFYYNNSELRLYVGNTMKVSSESKKIGKIEFDFVVNGNKNNVIPTGISCTSGSCEDFNKLSTSLTSAVWNAPTKNGVSEVTFTINGSAGNVGFKSAKVYYVLKSFDVAPASNNESYGTVSFEEGVITATPAEGYRVSLTNPYEVTPAGAATVVQDGNDFTVTATADCTVQINFEAIPTHTVTFSVNGTETSKQFSEGSPITFNTPDDVQGKKFVGWTAATIDGTTDECPKLVTLGTMGNADVKYYAVFANKEGTFENASIKIDANTEGVPSSYGTANTFAEHMLAGKKFQIQQMYKNEEKLQWRAAGNNSGTGTMYNSEAIKSIQSVVLNYDESDTNKNFTVKVGSEANPTNGNEITATTDGSIQKFDCAAQNCDFFVLTNGSGAGYLTSLTINYLVGSVTYSGYCTTLTLAAPTFSPAAGEVEKGTSVTITAEKGATLKYTVGETTTTTESNTATVTVNEDVTIKAVAVKDGVESEEVSAAYTVKAEEPVVEPGTPAAITAGFYTIKNLGNNQFVNVAGRKTATLVDNAEGMAGTVIQVESDADGIVKTLRSQGVDVPGYATRAMKYVPDVVKLVVEKLHVSGSGEILGETGVDKILDKFNKSVDVNLHVVHADGGYRIYGKTPSMTPVKEFYKENKANVDAKLPGLEKAINDAIATIVDKVGKGESLKNTFKLETIWKRMGWTDYEPGTEETTQVAFLQQVLANEENIWNFAYQTAMFYMEWVEGKQAAFQEMQDQAPELMKYWNLAKKVRPNFMYYIVQKDGKVDVISQGNEAILNNDKSTVWALEEVSKFKVNLTTSVEKTAYPTTGGEAEPYTEYYGTLYTDFAYRLPEGVTAYKVTGINTVGDKAYVKKAELNSEVVPAQTPVLLIANTGELTLTIAEGGEAVADNQLYGNDYLINEYDINTPQLEGVFNLLAQLSQSTYDKYEYLMRKNAGTVNNKYFFGIAVEGELNEAYYAKTGKEMESSPVRILGKNDNGEVGFFETWNNLAGNEGFMFSEEVSEILMNIVGDVNRDGTITISDVTALVNIILGKATYPADADKYDFEAADVNTDKTITISDVTALVNIILGK